MSEVSQNGHVYNEAEPPANPEPPLIVGQIPPAPPMNNDHVVYGLNKFKPTVSHSAAELNELLLRDQELDQRYKAAEARARRAVAEASDLKSLREDLSHSIAKLQSRLGAPK